MLGAIDASLALKYKKGNQLLFSRDSECLQDLMHLIGEQKHRTLVLWAFDCAQAPLTLFEIGHPLETRPRTALQTCQAWARGDVKMPVARKAILACHAVAKEHTDTVTGLLAHAIGQACSTVHVETHALGLVFYELSAIVYTQGLDGCQMAVEEKIKSYYDRLLYWQGEIEHFEGSWAPFLLDEHTENKEKVLQGTRRKSQTT
ncbi:hypothetical protein SpiGrapes_1770 [Sphaerochaeta pleomorpha str. Grapes]|uniref:Imm-5-like domain-containing protein n=1 Tax=Sphaerochaeta pleomorpha (strain ATCC BAA-1885 / DSM 22778 / Grapes) TaxID=158190 RepID=G8QXK3_SPHPG|nr:hypothetical protein [Sphaerochaeta pleomorpha]AEV29566.1 hypothetical protein SpiGrapes_1770 [Sphaerochaeta pleomorpha str. Grapes]